MTINDRDFHQIRSDDACSPRASWLEELYAPDAHAALDPSSPIVIGARGMGKSFWANVLGDPNLRADAAKAYPKIGLERVNVEFGYTGIEGPEGVGRDKLDACVPANANLERAKAFFWATILRALLGAAGKTKSRLPDMMEDATDVYKREDALAKAERQLDGKDQLLLVVYDALDTVATSWPRRRLLTQAVLEVAWAMRAYRRVRIKLFLRPDQFEDDGLIFVELPKQRAGAVQLVKSVGPHRSINEILKSGST